MSNKEKCPVLLSLWLLWHVQYCQRFFVFCFFPFQGTLGSRINRRIAATPGLFPPQQQVDLTNSLCHPSVAHAPFLPTKLWFGTTAITHHACGEMTRESKSHHIDSEVESETEAPWCQFFFSFFFGRETTCFVQDWSWLKFTYGRMWTIDNDHHAPMRTPVSFYTWS